MNTQEAIKKIRSKKTTFMGLEVPEFNYGIEVRAELQKMMESGEISPAEGYKAMKIEFAKMSDSEKAAEFEQLNGDADNASR